METLSVFLETVYTKEDGCKSETEFRAKKITVTAHVVKPLRFRGATSFLRLS